MLFTVTFVQNGDLLSHTSNSYMEIFDYYVSFCQRAATLAAMVPNSTGQVNMYDSEKLLFRTTIDSVQNPAN
jgi:hypothetical protein